MGIAKSLNRPNLGVLDGLQNSHQIDESNKNLGRNKSFDTTSTSDKKKDFATIDLNQVKSLSGNRLFNLNKDDLLNVLEELCKDFLQILIKNRTYDIKMKSIEIINSRP